MQDIPCTCSPPSRTAPKMPMIKIMKKELSWALMALLLASAASLSSQTRAQSRSSQAGTQSLYTPSDLPGHLLAFPFGSDDYQNKIVNIGPEAVIWTQRKISTWARGQGFSITQDSPDGGYQFGRALLFYPPGIEFNLRAATTEKGEYHAHGWFLVLDMGFLLPQRGLRRLSSDFRYYENILRYEILIDHIVYKTVEIGYGVTEPAPIQIAIPYIRDRAGNVKIEIRMKNHPNLFGIIYDAYLTMGD